MDLSWMNWTPPTAIFFAVIATLLVGMTCWEVAQPSIARKGWLPIMTTRGDRFFVGLLSSAYLHLAWLGLTDLSLWWALGIQVVWMAAVMRYG